MCNDLGVAHRVWISSNFIDDATKGRVVAGVVPSSLGTNADRVAGRAETGWPRSTLTFQRAINVDIEIGAGAENIEIIVNPDDVLPGAVWPRTGKRLIKGVAAAASVEVVTATGNIDRELLCRSGAARS